MELLLTDYDFREIYSVVSSSKLQQTHASGQPSKANYTPAQANGSEKNTNQVLEMNGDVEVHVKVVCLQMGVLVCK